MLNSDAKQIEAATRSFAGDPDAPMPLLAGKELQVLRADAEVDYPEMPVFQQIEHDRGEFFPVYLLTLPQIISPVVESNLNLFRMEMEMDGLSRSNTTLKSRFDRRQVHLWMIPWTGERYRPIGMAIFTEEERFHEKDAVRQGIVRWWLASVWLNPAQRRYHIFSNSFVHFKRWHPGFISTDVSTEIDNALKHFPEHRKKAGGEWVESEKEIHVIKVDNDKLRAALRPQNSPSVDAD